MYPVRILSVTSPRNNRSPSGLPTPVRGRLDKNPVPVEEVEGGGIGELKNNEGTLESSKLGASTILGGLWIGGVYVIIVGVAGAVEDGLKVSGKGHWGEGKRERGDDTGGEGTLNQWVHCEFVVSFEAIRPVITQQVCGEFF